MTDNLELWHKVEKTDPSQTKAITGKSYKGTSPKPFYLVQKATETFGPCGIGWGFKVLDERIEDGALIAPGFHERMSVARVLVWYKWAGERGEVEHIGGTLFSGKYASGKTFTDEDAPKKSVTDALVKALSMIGFAGDIFMGRYDDSKYVAELREEERESHKAAEQPKPKTRQSKAPDDQSSDAPLPLDPEESSQIKDHLIRTMDDCDTVPDLMDWASRNKSKIDQLSSRDQGLIRTAWAMRKHSFQEADKKGAA